MPLTTLLATDLITNSRTTLNDNFTYLEGTIIGGKATLLTAGAIPYISASGVLGESKLSCSGGICTLYDDTAVTGITTLAVRAGAEQGTSSMQLWLNAAGATMAKMDYFGSMHTSKVLDLTTKFGLESTVGFRMAAGFSAMWSSTAVYNGPVDLGLSRGAAGKLDVNNGIIGKPASLQSGSISLQSLATPSTPVITNGGTPGVVTYGYKITALLADGTTSTAASIEGTTTTGNATLNVTNYNIITITAVTGATSYSIYRTTGGATQGLIGNTTVLVFNDTGLSASGSAPTTNSTGSLLWATDGEGSIGASTSGRPAIIRASSSIAAPTMSATSVINSPIVVLSNSGVGSRITSASDGLVRLQNNGGTAFTRLQFGLASSSAPALATETINGFAIQSAAGTSTFNDAITEASATVAERKIFTIEPPTLTSTNASVTYTKAVALHLGLPTASTNVTIGLALSLLAEGPVDAQKYYCGGVIGHNGVVTVRNSAGDGTTALTFAYGILTGVA
jgi:hypothetical protein